MAASRACRWSHLRQLVGILPSPLQTSPPAMADVSSKHIRMLGCGSAQTLPATSPLVKSTHYTFEQRTLIIRARRSLDLRAQPSPPAMFARVWGGAPASMRVKCNDTRPACHRSFLRLVSAFDGSDRQRLPDGLTEHMFDYIIALVQE